MAAAGVAVAATSAVIAANEAREQHLLHLVAVKQQEIRHIREELKALAVEKAKRKKAEAKAKADRVAVEEKKVVAAKGGKKAVAAVPKGAVAARSKGAVKKLQLKTSKPSCSVVADGGCRGLHKHPDHKYMVGMSKEGIQYGPGFECWQCMHRARGGKGGHVHSCNKAPYAR